MYLRLQTDRMTYMKETDIYIYILNDVLVQLQKVLHAEKKTPTLSQRCSNKILEIKKISFFTKLDKIVIESFVRSLLFARFDKL